MRKSFLQFFILPAIGGVGCYHGVALPDETATFGPTTGPGGADDSGSSAEVDTGTAGADDHTDDTSPTPGCSPETCAGCCDGDVCRAGDGSSACGHGGSACQVCADDEVCEDFACVAVCRGEGSPCQYGAECCSDICDEGVCTAPDGCSTCENLGHTCGDWSDGCGGKIHCGTCGGDEVCDGGTCECQPRTCASLGKECGSWSDGCGGTLNCGSCPQNYDCEAGVCMFGCDSETFFLYNAMPDFSMYSVACDTVLQEFSYMYVCEDANNCSQAVPWGAHVPYELSWGAKSTLTAYCCHVDGTTCFGQKWECNVDGKSYPCLCTEKQFQLVADVCPSEEVVVCS